MNPGVDLFHGWMRSNGKALVLLPCVALVAIMLAGCDSSPSNRNASAAPVAAHIEGSPWSPWIGVSGFGASEVIEVEVDFTNDGSTDFTTSVTANLSGNASLSVAPENIRYGSKIRARSATSDRTLIVAEVRVEKVDAQDDAVSGVAPAGSQVLVSVLQAGPPLATAMVVADASGSWSHDFTGAYDIEPGRQVSAETSDAEGNITRATWSAVTPAISVGYSQYGANSLFVKWFAPGTAVRVRVDFGNDGGPLSGFDLDQSVVTTSQFGSGIDTGGFDVLHPGDRIIASGGGWTKEMISAPLRIEKADERADVVGGVASNGVTVTVGVSALNGGGPPVASATVAAGADGRWSADFSSTYDISPDQPVMATVADDDGDETFTTWLAKTATFAAGVTDGPPSGVSLVWFAVGTSVRLRVDYANDGSVDVDMTRTVTQMMGETFDLGGPGLLHAGDLVTVTGGGWTKSGILAVLAIDTVDHSTDVVAGTAAPGAQIKVDVNPAPGEPGGPPVASTTVTAGADGRWTAAFSGSTDIVLNQQVMATISDSDGDMTQAVGWARTTVWPKTGFERPILNPPAVNTVKAGSVIPVKFSLGGDRGLNILSAGYPRAPEIACGSNVDADGGDPIRVGGKTTLSYNSVSGLYEIKWATLKSWKGTCRQLVVRFLDGTYLRANFRFN